MILYLLNRLRVILKSIGKKEETLNDLITFFRHKKNYKQIKKFAKKNLFSNGYESSKKLSLNIAVTITFFYNEKKIKHLAEVCKNLYFVSKNCNIFIITNKIPNKEKKLLLKKIKYKNSKITINVVDQLINDRLLPWCHIPVMKDLYKNKKYTHFLYLEDDISLSKNNILYWLNAREILKKNNLIPGFIRTEIDKKTNKIYALDFTNITKSRFLPKININKNSCFINYKFPYQGMYFYDRKLMGEHLKGASSNPDFGHGAFNIKYLSKQMINFDLMAKASVGLIYKDVPKEFLNRLVIPYDSKNNKILDCCLIKHLPNKYVKLQSLFGSITIDNAIK
tara:strand:+ start:1922 stop:2932 length:1011 start_codon:yes stop_codon:yes gene_type:complete